MYRFSENLGRGVTAMDEKEKKLETTAGKENSIKWYSYVALLFAIVFFSGIFATSKEWYSVFDFTVLTGKFGTIAATTGKSLIFRGAGGSGCKDGFAFALTLLPAIIFALGVVNVVEGLGGLNAAQKLLSSLLKPGLGIPGACGLGMIASFQSTDAGAGMIKAMKQEGLINEDERTIFAMFQLSGDGIITNYFSSGAALFSILMVPIGLPFVVILAFKVFGANLMRLYVKWDNARTNKEVA